MASAQTDNLFRLIKTMTKSEKRSFKLYVNRIGGTETAKFIQLFDVLDKQKAYDEGKHFSENTDDEADAVVQFETAFVQTIADEFTADSYC